MRKKISAILFTLMALCAVFVIDSFSMTADAATFVIKSNPEPLGWRWIPNDAAVWDDTIPANALSTLDQYIKEDDSIVVLGDAATLPVLKINKSVAGVYISGGAVVSVNSAKQVYVLKDVTAAVNGDVKRAYVYDDARATFNNNVDELYFINTKRGEGEFSAVNANVAGEVKKMQLRNVIYNDFKANTLKINNGKLITETSNYGTEEIITAEKPSSVIPFGTEDITTTTTQKPAASANDLDEVPKTGDASFAFILATIAAGVALLLAGVKVRR